MINELKGSFNIAENIIETLSTGRIALLDADYVKYVLPDRIWKRYQEVGEYPPIDKMTKDWVDQWLLKISDPIIFCFSGRSKDTFRNYVAFEKEYKGNRKEKSDYRNYPHKIDDMYGSVKYIKENNVFLLFVELEADDVLSALQDYDNTYIISKDKDLKQVPGWHYDWDTNSIYEITKEKGLYLLAKQLITGDNTDNIPGIKGVGEVSAKKILNGIKPQHQIQVVLHEYQKRFGIFKGTDMFVEMWNLVKMRENRGDFFKKKFQKMFDLKELLINGIKKRI